MSYQSILPPVSFTQTTHEANLFRSMDPGQPQPQSTISLPTAQSLTSPVIETHIQTATNQNTTSTPFTPRDAYEIRQGHFPGMKPIQPRGGIVPVRPPDVTLRSMSADQDLTLAGKPRKRSAQACFRCREMKIKCRLHGTGCITCLRQGLSCTFEASKTGLRTRRSTKLKGDSLTDGADVAISTKPATKRPCLDARTSSDLTRTSSATESSEISSSSYPPINMHRSSGSGPPPTPPDDAGIHGHTRAIHELSQRTRTPLSLDTDPFTAAYQHAIDSQAQFHAGIATRSQAVMVPKRESRVSWTGKTRNERMLLYAILAAGAWFTVEDNASSGDVDERVVFCRMCKQVAEDAVVETAYKFDRIVVQTQLILELVGLPDDDAATRS
jgi:hypothetical protein